MINLSDGTVNKWNRGAFGVETDLAEANQEAMAWIVHPCNSKGCYCPGADMNSYRQHFTSIYGPGKLMNRNKPCTVLIEIHHLQLWHNLVVILQEVCYSKKS